MEHFIDQLPKVELHVHLEGTLSPELLFRLANKHNVTLPYTDVDSLKQAYRFNSLDEFLRLYYQGCDVLRDQDDFYLLTKQYLDTCISNHVMHCELFFDPQAHTERGVSIATQMAGICQALDEAEQQGITHRLIACMLRHLPASQALDTFDALSPHLDRIHGIGLDSSEQDFPPRLFKAVFEKAHRKGLEVVAHAGEEAGADYIIEALDVLEVSRIDHGVRCEDDPDLVERIIRERIPLTMCPLSNLKLGVINAIEDHNAARLLRKGACVTVNSDDPAYFGGDISDNYKAIQRAFNLTHDELGQLSLNAIEASFAPPARKAQMVCQMMSYLGHDDEFSEWVAEAQPN